VGIRVGGPHIEDESWELDRGCDSVHWCGILVAGCRHRGVDLPEVLTLLHIFTYLECCYCFADLPKPSIAKVGSCPA
jgi:hypothetical protein